MLLLYNLRHLKFLDADEYELLEDVENNLEKIKDAITGHIHFNNIALFVENDVSGN